MHSLTQQQNYYGIIHTEYELRHTKYNNEPTTKTKHTQKLLKQQHIRCILTKLHWNCWMKEVNPGIMKKFARNSLPSYYRMVHCYYKTLRRTVKASIFVKRIMASVLASAKLFNWRSTVSKLLVLCGSVAALVVSKCISFSQVFIGFPLKCIHKPTKTNRFDTEQSKAQHQERFLVCFRIFVTRPNLSHYTSNCNSYRSFVNVTHTNSITVFFCTVANCDRKKRRHSNFAMRS